MAEVCIKLAIYRSLNLKQIMQNGSEDQVELTMNNIVVLSVKITSRSTCINSNYVILSVEIIYITHTQTSRIKNSGFVQRLDQLSRINFHSVILKLENRLLPNVERFSLTKSLST